MPVWYNTEQYTGTIESHCPWVCASKAPNLACERDQKWWHSAILVGPGCFLLYRKILCPEVIDPLMVLSCTMWCVFYHHLHFRSCLGLVSVQQELSHSNPLLSQKYGLWVWWELHLSDAADLFVVSFLGSSYTITPVFSLPCSRKGHYYKYCT